MFPGPCFPEPFLSDSFFLQQWFIHAARKKKNEILANATWDDKFLKPATPNIPPWSTKTCYCFIMHSSDGFRPARSSTSYFRLRCCFFFLFFGVIVTAPMNSFNGSTSEPERLQRFELSKHVSEQQSLQSHEFKDNIFNLQNIFRILMEELAYCLAKHSAFRR